jgi:hypothetical protein
MTSEQEREEVEKFVNITDPPEIIPPLKQALPKEYIELIFGLNKKLLEVIIT